MEQTMQARRLRAWLVGTKLGLVIVGWVGWVGLVWWMVGWKFDCEVGGGRYDGFMKSFSGCEVVGVGRTARCLPECSLALYVDRFV